MATINDSTNSEGNAFQEFIDSIQGKWLDFIDATSEKFTEWQGRFVEWKEESFESIQNTFEEAQPYFASWQESFVATWDDFREIDWSSKVTWVKDNVVSSGVWIGKHSWPVVAFVWRVFEEVVDFGYKFAITFPKLAFNSMSYIPLISFVPAIVRTIGNIFHIIFSFVRAGFNLLTFRPMKMADDFAGDWHSIFSRQVRACTEWFPIIGNLMWLYYDLKVLSYTEEEREKFAPFGVFWG